MILTITTHVEKSIQETWLTWMKKTFIPAMMATNTFSEALMTQIEAVEDKEGFTYSVQYKVKDEKALQKYEQEYAHEIGMMLLSFGEKALSFSTKMKVIHQHENE